jgi:hypothetical protein
MDRPKIEELPDGLRVSWRRARWSGGLLAVAGLAIDAALPVWVFLSEGGPSGWHLSDMLDPILLLPFIQLVMGTGLLYAGLARLLNEETLTVSGELLVVRSAPLPWPGARVVGRITRLELEADADGTLARIRVTASSGRRRYVAQRLPRALAEPLAQALCRTLDLPAPEEMGLLER